jgi:hypothetical protein
MVLGIGKRSWVDRKRQVGKVASVAGMGALTSLPSILPGILLMAQANRVIGKL